MKYHIGFTGTREGMSPAQKAKLIEVIEDFISWIWDDDEVMIHHGDCVGSDAQMHFLARYFGFGVKVHPPTEDRLQAHSEGATITVEPKPYLARNRDIVDEADIVIATPAESTGRGQRGGTWYTIRYATDSKTPTTIIYPDGSIKEQ